MAQITNDFGSNAEENLERWAKVLRRPGKTRIVFDVIYSSKKTSWSNAEVAAKTGLDQKAVSEAAKALLDRVLLVRQSGKVIRYSKRPDVYREKRKLLSLAGNPKKLAALPTKRKPKVSIAASLNRNTTFRAIRITIDEIDNFSAVKRIDKEDIPTELDPPRLSEDVFKRGLENILSERGGLKDWGGENLDLFSTHLTIGGRRKAVGIALKGPGKTGSLTPGKMGTNGDQIDRLLSQSIDVAIVQYEGTVANSVHSLLEKLSREKSRSESKHIYFCVIDLFDSYRLRLAYYKQFTGAAVQPNQRKQAKVRKGRIRTDTRKQGREG